MTGFSSAPPAAVVEGHVRLSMNFCAKSASFRRSGASVFAALTAAIRFFLAIIVSRIGFASSHVITLSLFVSNFANSSAFGSSSGVTFPSPFFVRTLEKLLGGAVQSRAVSVRTVDGAREENGGGTGEDERGFFHGTNADENSQGLEDREDSEVAAQFETRTGRGRLRVGSEFRAVENNPVAAALAAAHDLALLRDQLRAAHGAHAVGCGIFRRSRRGIRR